MKKSSWRVYTTRFFGLGESATFRDRATILDRRRRRRQLALFGKPPRPGTLSGARPGRRVVCLRNPVKYFRDSVRRKPAPRADRLTQDRRASCRERVEV